MSGYTVTNPNKLLNSPAIYSRVMKYKVSIVDKILIQNLYQLKKLYQPAIKIPLNELIIKSVEFF